MIPAMSSFVRDLYMVPVEQSKKLIKGELAVVLVEDDMLLSLVVVEPKARSDRHDISAESCRDPTTSGVGLPGSGGTKEKEDVRRNGNICLVFGCKKQLLQTTEPPVILNDGHWGGSRNCRKSLAALYHRNGKYQVSRAANLRTNTPGARAKSTCIHLFYVVQHSRDVGHLLLTNNRDIRKARPPLENRRGTHLRP